MYKESAHYNKEMDNTHKNIKRARLDLAKDYPVQLPGLGCLCEINKTTRYIYHVATPLHLAIQRWLPLKPGC